MILRVPERLDALPAILSIICGGVAERGSDISQIPLNLHRERMRTTEHAPGGPNKVLECLEALAEIVGGRPLVKV